MKPATILLLLAVAPSAFAQLGDEALERQRATLEQAEIDAEQSRIRAHRLRVRSAQSVGDALAPRAPLDDVEPTTPEQWTMATEADKDAILAPRAERQRRMADQPAVVYDTPERAAAWAAAEEEAAQGQATIADVRERKKQRAAEAERQLDTLTTSAIEGTAGGSARDTRLQPGRSAPERVQRLPDQPRVRVEREPAYVAPDYKAPEYRPEPVREAPKRVVERAPEPKPERAAPYTAAQERSIRSAPVVVVRERPAVAERAPARAEPERRTERRDPPARKAEPERRTERRDPPTRKADSGPRPTAPISRSVPTPTNLKGTHSAPQKGVQQLEGVKDR